MDKVVEGDVTYQDKTANHQPGVDELFVNVYSEARKVVMGYKTSMADGSVDLNAFLLDYNATEKAKTYARTVISNLGAALQNVQDASIDDLLIDLISLSMELLIRLLIRSSC